MTTDIQIRSRFDGWKSASKEVAYEWAKSFVYGLGYSREDDRAIDIVNSRLKGIRFTKEQLYEPVEYINKQFVSNGSTSSPEPKNERTDKSRKEVTFDSETAKRFNQLAREQNKAKLLADILMDMEICKLEGWNVMEYLNDLSGIIDSLKKNK